jgi:hypothetical protein
MVPMHPPQADLVFTVPTQAQADLAFTLSTDSPRASLTSPFSTHRLKASVGQLSQLEGAALRESAQKFISLSSILPGNSKFRDFKTPRELLTSNFRCSLALNYISAVLE